MVTSEVSVPRSGTAWVLASLSASILISSMGTSIANVALPTLAEALDAPFRSVQWIVLSYLMAITTVIVSVGRLGDIFGRRRLILSGIALFTAASVLGGLASGLWLLIAARAAQGLGAAIMLALTMTFVADAVEKERAGSAMGLLGTMSAVGTALGPSLGGVLIAVFGWRAIFLVNLPLGLVTFLLAWRALPADGPRAGAGRPRVDVTGMLLLALALGLYAAAMTLGKGGFGLLNLGLLGAGLAVLAVFVLVETRARSPLIRMEMLQEAALASGFSMSALVSTVMMATMIVGPFYLARGLGLGPELVGAVMAAGPVVAALAGVPAGRGVDRFGARRVTVVGLVAVLAGAMALSQTTPGSGVLGYVGPLVVVTAGYALFQAANNTAVMAGVGRDRRGVVSGMLNLSRNLGLITGAAFLGAVFALASGSADVTTAGRDAIAAGTRGTFAVAAGLVGLALILALRARKAG